MGQKQKKTMLLDAKLLDEARRALGVRTETEAVTRLLEEAVRRRHFAESLEELARLGPFDASRIED